MDIARRVTARGFTGCVTCCVAFCTSLWLIMATDSGFSQTSGSGDQIAPSPFDDAFSTEVGEQLDAAFRDGRLRNLHSVVLVSNDQLLVERYYEGKDERWGRRLGRVEFTPETLHDLRSVSKSLVGMLYGIALSEGKVAAPGEPLLKHLPQYAELADERRSRITIGNALSMQLGFQWDEDLPYTDPRNSEHAMELSPDRCRFVLEQPLVHEPGTRWKYSGGATALIACLLVEGTGVPLPDYANAKLFEPLGITHFEWVTGHDGVAIAASGLRMRPRDLAKLGQLVLNGGVLDGRQLIPHEWLETSLESHAQIDYRFNYGYHWWLARRWGWVGAFGNGGQRLVVLRKRNLALVVTAGNYNDPEAWKVPASVLTDVILPALDR